MGKLLNGEEMEFGMGTLSKIFFRRLTNAVVKEKISRKAAEWAIRVTILVGVPVGDTVNGAVTVGVRVTKKCRKGRWGCCKKKACARETPKDGSICR